MRKPLAQLALAVMALFSALAFETTADAQGVVQQSGAVTPGHVAAWFQNGVIGDGGGGSGVSGFWTPVMALSSTGTSSFVYTTQSGNYFCTGGNPNSLVFLDFDVASTPTIGTGTGNVLLEGLPYPIADTNNTNGSPLFLSGSFSGLLSLPYYSSVANTAALNFLTQAGNSSSTIGYATLTTGLAFEIIGTITYITPGSC